MSESLSALLDKVRALFASYVVVPSPEYLDVIALWISHSHAIGSAETSPRLVFKSPEKESGKTRALEVLELLTPNPLSIINTTIAAVFRLLDQETSTILFDEVDSVFAVKTAPGYEELRALLNGGYRRGATVARVVGEGKKMRVQRFSVFAATVLAAIGDLPDTIESRAIIVPMRRRAPDEPVAPFRRRRALDAATELREALAAWAVDNLYSLSDADPEIPEGIADRSADCWEPLFAIAELAGDDWPERAHAAAKLILEGRVADDLSLGVRLLADIKAAIGTADRMSSAAMVAALNALDEAGWGGWHDGKGMTVRDLARKLKPYDLPGGRPGGIRPKTIRLDDNSTPKGYLRGDFADAWARYLRAIDGPPVTSATSATSATQIRIPVADVAAVADFGGEGKNGHSRVAIVQQGDFYQLVNDIGQPKGVGLFASNQRAVNYAQEQGWVVVNGRES
jgi:hypothetical protein